MTDFYRWILAIPFLLASAYASIAQNTPVSVLWLDANPGWDVQNADHRQHMADYLTNFGGGGQFKATFVSSTRPGDLAQSLNGPGYDVVVLDVTNRRSSFNAADLDALRSHYAAGHRALMLDGSLWIRSGRPKRDNQISRHKWRNRRNNGQPNCRASRGRRWHIDRDRPR